jgi:hypothetical protein
LFGRTPVDEFFHHTQSADASIAIRRGSEELIRLIDARFVQENSSPQLARQLRKGIHNSNGAWLTRCIHTTPGKRLGYVASDCGKKAAQGRETKAVSFGYQLGHCRHLKVGAESRAEQILGGS